MRRNSKPGNRLSLERLEDRTLMAGNVSVAVENGYLNITGDDLANSITVESTAVAGVYRIYGHEAASAPTKINSIDTEATGSYVEVSGVKQGVNIELRAGDDELKFGSEAQKATVFPRWVNIDAGDGNDQVEFGRAGNAADPTGRPIAVKTDLAIRMGNGLDQLSVAALTVHKGMLIDMGAGDDQLRMDTSFTPAGGNERIYPARVGRDLKIQLGDGDDEMTAANLRVNGKATIMASGGATELSLSDSRIKGKLKIDLAEGIDVVALDHVIGSSFGLNTNEGADDVTLEYSRFKWMDIDLGADVDKLTVKKNRVTQYTKLDGGLDRADYFDQGGNSFKWRIRRRF